MPDAFQEALEAQPTEDGPFRTPEETDERRLERAREQSFTRVAEKTEVLIQRERASARRWRWLARGVLGLTALLAFAVLCLAATVGRTWIAWSCPALALAISCALVVIRLGGERPRMPLSGPEEPPQV